MDTRKEMQENISTALFNRTKRNKNIQYCKEHADERARLIEKKIFDNCIKETKKWTDVYKNINVDLLIDSIESNTIRCIYR